MMPTGLRTLLRRLRSRTAVEIYTAGLLASLLAIAAAGLPKIDLLQSAINDDNFTDMVLSTRGELPIDSNIRVLTYDASILDTFDMVDRSTLAMQLAALFELKPRVVGVDFLIETERPEAADGDAMIAALAADHPNLLFGVFHEDSLHRFRLPPPRFKIPERQLGCINLLPDDDNTVRDFRPLWGDDGKKQIESFDVKVARWVDSSAVAYLRSFGSETFIIDYAAGIGEVQRQGAAGDQIFPVMPLRAVFDAMTSGDTNRIAAMRMLLAGKTVLVGYGDIRNSQVTSVVDRFYTPFKPEKNTLPDMHGVAIHANIVNTILKRRVLEPMPTWLNVLWSALLAAALLAGRERLERIARPTLRTAAAYSGFAALFLLAALLPVLAFRYTPYKFSIFMPIGALLIAVPTLEGLQKAIDLALDLRRRARLRAGVPEPIRSGMLAILKAWSPQERLARAIHFVQTQFTTICAVLFAEAAAGGAGRSPRFPSTTLASPTLARMLSATRAFAGDLSPRARAMCELLGLLSESPEIERALRLARSLHIAANEIRRQSLETTDDQTENEPRGGAQTDGAQADGSRPLDADVVGYADLALKTLADRTSGDDEEQFDALYRAVERYARAAAAVLAATPEAGLPSAAEELPPYIILRRCALHRHEEQFIYVSEQQDANNRDDLFDLVYSGRTLRCHPLEHPGLTQFRAQSAPARDDGEDDTTN